MPGSKPILLPRIILNLHAVTLESEKDMTALKIGVLTFHRCINYGSYWQARCLADGLRAYGHQAEILDHESQQVKQVEWRCAFQPTLPTAVPKADYPLYREKILRFFQAFASLPLSPRFPLDAPDQMDNYDVVVVGSDEVWNLAHPWYGGCPLFYGDGLRTKRLISYAASFGNYSAWWGLEQTWAEKLQNFEHISVRDDNSQAIIKNALGFEPEIVLDPCLQFPVIPEDRAHTFMQKPYVAVYGHNFSQPFIREVRRWAAGKKLPLVSIGYRNDWADAQWLTADPHDFAHFMARSEAVATNFFHGCVFALRNAKPFACEASDYRSFKVQGLMALLDSEKHLLRANAPAVAYDACLGNPLNTVIIQQIENLRQKSTAYLSGALRAKRTQLA